ncbi:hypothetical protein HPB48_002156 [Haemaphysalis longicornis]|uniref:Uncharacterized protein n=1 Tax=Haemaphysalis longicornis TaxID=44386 RepID=A0A9J6FGG5_HAELO|nr:hypothetical protein HPB48_002156 [Haemaphysalis longicornis]
MTAYRSDAFVRDLTPAPPPTVPPASKPTLSWLNKPGNASKPAERSTATNLHTNMVLQATDPVRVPEYVNAPHPKEGKIAATIPSQTQSSCAMAEAPAARSARDTSDVSTHQCEQVNSYRFPSRSTNQTFVTSDR